MDILATLVESIAEQARRRRNMAGGKLCVIHLVYYTLYCPVCVQSWMEDIGIGDAERRRIWLERMEKELLEAAEATFRVKHKADKA